MVLESPPPSGLTSAQRSDVTQAGPLGSEWGPQRGQSLLRAQCQARLGSHGMCSGCAVWSPLPRPGAGEPGGGGGQGGRAFLSPSFDVVQESALRLHCKGKQGDLGTKGGVVSREPGSDSTLSCESGHHQLGPALPMLLHASPVATPPRTLIHILQPREQVPRTPPGGPVRSCTYALDPEPL